ncbi:MAG: type III-B CRISPR module-associated protein Cmr5 [Fimbriimonadaceae bacterium]|nr:type III-B CRISPR module-associated protein Cmr5 [Fimbriimonadaceae bacterium]
MTRDQQRAQHAYARVAEVPRDERADYEVFVKDLGACLLRSGLAVAICTLEREHAAGRRAAGTLLGHLATASIPGLAGTDSRTLGAQVRQLELAAYLLASRETLRVATWLKRAVEAPPTGG